MSGDPVRDEVHLFIYGTLLRGGGAEALLDGCARVSRGVVGGTLYRTPDGYPALVLSGPDAVHGEVWRCPVERIPAIDAYEDVAGGLFRRVGVEVNGRGCWTYAAGPALGPVLQRSVRLKDGRWTSASRPDD